MSLKKIAITGPESTGKSTLAQQLAHHFQTVFVPEYARTYIGQLTRNYTLSDILHIAQQQLILEQKTLPKANQYLICDTELIVTKIWSEHAFGECPPWIEQMIVQHPYDLYLLMEVDIAWQADEQREHPHLRKYFFDWYQEVLETFKLPYQIIQGEGHHRLHNAIKAIQNS